MTSVSKTYQDYLRDNWSQNPTFTDLAVMGMGLCGEAGECTEHFKKVVRDYDYDFSAYPKEKRTQALLEYGDCLHYLLKQAGQFGFTLEQIMAANMDKLDYRFNRASWRHAYHAEENPRDPLRGGVMT